jgi:alpha-tubulin suppressor-like RCC1 family protein
MTIDKDALLQKFQNLLDVSYIDATSKVDDVLVSALLTEIFEKENIITVANVNALPNLKYYNSPSGMLYYIDDIDIFAVSSNYRWLTLDGRVLRQDSVFGIGFGWGSGSNGRLGDDTITTRSSPVSVVGGFTDWCDASAGSAHSLGVRQDGSLWAWGANANGRLGDDTITTRSSPVSVVGGFTDWCAASAGIAHSLGVRTNGSLWAWGANNNGQLGDDTITTRSSPVSVVGGFTDWCAASAGTNHSLGVRQGGSLWAWGSNNSGQLGDDTITSRSSPVSVVGGFTDWCAASAGGYHSLGVRTNGSLWAWGLNSNGRLGDDTITSRRSPVSVVGGFTDWCAASAGDCHSLGVRTNGSLWAWGLNSSGQLGDDTITSRRSPVSVVGGFTDWCQVSAGTNHSLGVRTNGSLWSWGLNGFGQLGDDTTTTRCSPVSVVGGFTDWCAASAGGVHSIGLRIRC